MNPRATLAAALLAALGTTGCFPDDPSVIEPMPMPEPGMCEVPEFPGLAKDALPPGMGKHPLPAPVVVGADVPPARRTGHAIVAQGKHVHVVDRDNDALVRLDAFSGAIVKTIELGGRPEQAVAMADGTLFITLRHAGQVARLKPGASVAATFDVGVAPVGLALSPDESRVWVAVSAEDKIVALDTKTGAKVATVFVAPRPRRVMALPKSAKAGPMLVVSHEWGRVTEVPMGPSGKAEVPKLRPLRSHNPAELAFMNFDMDVAGHINGKQSAEPGQDRASRSVAITAVADGGYLVGHTLENRGQPSGKGQSSGGYGGGPGCSPIPQRPIQVSVTPRGPSRVMLSSPSSSPVRDPKTQRDFLARFDQPADMVHHPSASLAFLVATGTDNVLVLNTAVKDPIRSPVAAIAVGQGPRAIALSPDGKTAWVLNGHSFDVSRVDLAPLLDRVVADPEQATTSKHRLKQPVMLEAKIHHTFGVDPLPPLLREGRRIFHHTPNTGISEASRFACASCHYEGDEDKKVWFVDGEPRQTPALAGRLLGTAPFNWKGTEHQLQNNMDQTIERMGGKGLDAKQLAALEAFLTHGLVPPPNPNQRASGLTKAEQRGKDLFFDPKVGCGGCHVDGTGTNSLSVDVGVADNAEKIAVAQRMANESGKKVKWQSLKLPYDTPSLRGVWHTAPYFHNGRAKTLKEALKMTAKTMGRTDHLTDAQLDDLVAYLKTL